jgi:hypothetical protein
MRFRPIILDPISSFFITLLVLSQFLLNNGIYLLASSATFVILFFLLQQRYKPGILAFILLQHILQVIATVWLCNYLGKDIDYRSYQSSRAIYLSLIGMFFLFSPLIYFQVKLPNVNLSDLKRHAEALSTEKAMQYYFISFIIATLVGAVAFLYSGFTQIIFSLIKLKWLFFLLFGFLAILKKEKRNMFYLAIALEFFSGFFSFFSEFKTVIYFLVILLLTFIYSINIKQIFIGIIVGAVLTFLALGWSSIKGDYRAFLNGGTKQQTVDVSRDEALNKLADLSEQVNADQISNSTKDLLDRLQYTYHFAKTLERVPEQIPFQNGNNWLEDIEFATTPRYLNPDKPILDNSIKASKYTGIHYLGAKSGVSFSLGYFAECYIDFGPYGMMIFLLIIGFVFGLTYNYLMRKSSKNIIFNYSVVGAFFMEFYAYEMDGTYLSGRFLSSLLTFILLVNFVFPTIMKNLTILKPNIKSVNQFEYKFNEV